MNLLDLSRSVADVVIANQHNGYVVTFLIGDSQSASVVTSIQADEEIVQEILTRALYSTYCPGPDDDEELKGHLEVGKKISECLEPLHKLLVSAYIIILVSQIDTRKTIIYTELEIGVAFHLIASQLFQVSSGAGPEHREDIDENVTRH